MLCIDVLPSDRVHLLDVRAKEELGWVCVTQTNEFKAKLGFEFPQHILLIRGEIYDEIARRYVAEAARTHLHKAAWIIQEFTSSKGTPLR